MYYEIVNHIGIFENVVDNNICDKIIQHFNISKENRLTRTRQDEPLAALKINKDTETYYLSGTAAITEEHQPVDELTLMNDKWMFKQFKAALLECYKIYTDKYGVIETLSEHNISGTVKIQRTLPGEGYHIWHCEQAGVNTGNRLLLAILYLNDVDQGGETEFLYQGMRIPPRKGSLIICPASFTHTHRGNPPLKGEKYILNTWVEFVK